jgi:hypothetical protein
MRLDPFRIRDDSRRASRLSLFAGPARVEYSLSNRAKGLR